MNTKGLISIIVPIYNSESTLDRTLNSIVNQSYNDLEAILVNDGSQDNSLSICEKYKSIDPRIKIISKENGGVGTARNVGLDVASGEFISFVDSDDEVDKDFYKILYETAVITGADIVESGVDVTLPTQEHIFPYEKPEKMILCDNETYMKNYLNFSFNVSVWGKIYKRDLIGDIRFPDLNINEDFIFLWEIVKRTSLCCENLNTNYHYYLDKEDSLSKTPFGHNHLSMIDHLEELVSDVKGLHPELIDEAENHYSACLLHTLILYYNYLTSEKRTDYLLAEKDVLFEATKKMTPINSYLLLHESAYNVDELIGNINSMVRGKSK